ncbi:helix-turn-helix domain-containing protein [Rhizohabitans arisaemae]|uniref:helix-turn-helix domain-containing protein n=1 Tax=Rhizohabitans arisaemae TaxID=2720610 RepID=UPI0024B0656D|nr:helix-turn-helix transcriptional regulator [Rhizohabitans arisaemae]
MGKEADMGLAKRRKAMGYSQERLAHALGVDRTTVGRWERGETTPEGVHRPKMAMLLHLDLAELDVMLTLPRTACLESVASPSGDCHGSGHNNDVIRREFLRLMATTGALTALAHDEAEAIADAVERGSIDDFHQMNDHLWRVYLLARSKGSITLIVREQLGVLNDALRKSHQTSALCEVAGDLLQLSGELAFDANRYTDAAADYTLATSASGNAHAFDLWACALVRHAYLDVFEGRFAQAAETLEVAWRIAIRGDSARSTRHWVASVQAAAYAGLGTVGSCERALDEAQQVADLNGPVDNGGWLRFDGSRLDEERGACYVRLGRLDPAETALKRALVSDALTKGQSIRRRGAALADLAVIGMKRRDVEQLLTYGGEALRLAQQSGSGYIARKLQALRADFGSWGRDRRVAELDAEIGVLGVM